MVFRNRFNFFYITVIYNVRDSNRKKASLLLPVISVYYRDGYVQNSITVFDLAITTEL